ncbi:MAG: U2 snRNP auxiliary factor, large subunit [Monoraphidium minutum]|nr:MAG: U2 snRNP auxiliary factor, large subunit [Monoraphidium minutum]
MRQAALHPQHLYATRHARRVYVGGLPPGCGEVELTNYVNQLLLAIGACSHPGVPVLSVYLNADKRYAFVEVRTAEEASNLLALDGALMTPEGLRLRRPHDYDPAAARALGSLEPSPHMSLALVPAVVALLTPCTPRVSVGGLPPHLTEDELRKLLGAFGCLRALTYNAARGSAVAEFSTPAETEAAAAGLGSMSLAGQQLSVARQGPLQNALALRQLAAQQQAALVARLTGKPPPPPVSLLGALEAAGAAAPQAALRAVRLEGMVARDELVDPDEYSDLVADISEEVSKYGRLARVLVPRPAAAGGGGGGGAEDPPGVGLVFLEYEDAASAEAARAALDGREFGGRRIAAALVGGAELELAARGAG